MLKMSDVKDINENEEAGVSKIDNFIRMLIFIVFVLLIVEGALRKWVLPSLSSPIFFIKDVVIVYIYFLVYKHRRMMADAFMALTVLMGFMFYLLATAQAFILSYSLTIASYGWRNYCLYIPFSLIIAKFSRFEDIKKIAKFTCIAAIPIAVLVYLQYSSPKDSYINKNVGGDKSEIFTVVDDVVRPSGPFSFNTGMSNYTAFLFVTLMFNFFLGRKKFLQPLLFYACVFAFFVCLACSGSRGAYLAIGIEMGFLLFASIFLLKKKEGFQIIASSVLIILLAVVLFNFVFERQLSLILRRQEIASQAEGSIIKRALGAFIDFESLLNSNLTFLGSGMGLGSGGGGYLATGTKVFLLAETEWARHLQEAGIFMGLIYIFFRIGLTITLLKNVLGALFKGSTPIPMLFFSVVLINLLIGPITGNGIAYSFNWILVGISMAVNKIYLNSLQNT